ncbi:AAA family ATPase [Thauera sp. CAU 1555]|uniref:AAA family ATPase n=1 Tax=Thauera sedimentorum TaxID=2767595 RepID=A0ABR9B7E4_9RHOO|nr:ATP-binding protein [Thauera sedimentorum]MBC9071374.1 AAA family ATPase [Thauera sedimentorum]MBD8502293.1 AAA family ATPase [Thauera sedimentorum]
MILKKVILKKFKRVDTVELDLSASPISVLIGPNNCGKSSVLQGIHFSVTAAIASREADRSTYAQDALLYCPARDFKQLRHGDGYANQSNFGHLQVFADFPDDEGEENYSIRIYRGRNEGNVGCQRSGSAKINAHVANSDNLFSVYVPGLAGIPQTEQFRSESVIRRGVASGDANLHLRNVLYILSRRDRGNMLETLKKRMRALFPQFHLWVDFNPAKDVYIGVEISTTGQYGRRCPLELVGTGVLQALQIFSYVTLFSPKLLLLDEPDSHLHPDNQVLLAEALRYITSESGTKVVISTHSRHLVEAMYGEANFVWLKNGSVFKQGVELERLPLLLDIGALDSFDKLMAGTISFVFLTEDTDKRMLQALVARSGFPMSKCLIYSYKTSTNLESAKILAAFILKSAPKTTVVIHRDRDFMTDEEVGTVSAKISDVGAVPFITEHSDVEGYFIVPGHIAELTGKDPSEVAEWLNSIAREEHVAIQHDFTRKRDELKQLLYKGAAKFPDTIALLGKEIPLPPEKRVGKAMLRRVRSQIKDFAGTVPDFLKPTVHIWSPGLKLILESITDAPVYSPVSRGRPIRVSKL